jgi:hypothetical protein
MISMPTARPGRKRQPALVHNAFTRWLEATKMTFVEAADLLGISKHQVRNYRLGTIPPLSVAMRIQLATKGAVPTDSWISKRKQAVAAS